MSQRRELIAFFIWQSNTAHISRRDFGGKKPFASPGPERGDGTELVCGIFQLRSLTSKPIAMAALPRVLRVKTTSLQCQPDARSNAAQILAMELKN